MKKSDLLELLEDLPDETEIVVCPCHEITGWCNDIIFEMHHDNRTAILCLFEETDSYQERDVKPGQPHIVVELPEEESQKT